MPPEKGSGRLQMGSLNLMSAEAKARDEGRASGSVVLHLVCSRCGSNALKLKSNERVLLHTAVSRRAECGWPCSPRSCLRRAGWGSGARAPRRPLSAPSPPGPRDRRRHARGRIDARSPARDRPAANARSVDRLLDRLPKVSELSLGSLSRSHVPCATSTGPGKKARGNTSAAATIHQTAITGTKGISAAGPG